MESETQSVFVAKEQEKRRAWSHRTLSNGAKWLFGVLTDLAWLHQFGGDGTGRSIAVGAGFLANFLGVSRSSIQAWSRELRDAGFVWCTRATLPNALPILVYHIAALVPPNGECGPKWAGAWGARVPEPENQASKAQNVGQPSPNFGPAQPKNRASQARNLGQLSPNFGPAQPKNRASQARNLGQPSPNFGPTQPKNQAPQAQDVGCDGVSECGAMETTSGVCTAAPGQTQDQADAGHTHTEPVNLPQFEPLDWKIFRRLRGPIADREIAACRAELAKLPDSEAAQPIRRAYSQRIAELTRWAAGLRHVPKAPPIQTSPAAPEQKPPPADPEKLSAMIAELKKSLKA